MDISIGRSFFLTPLFIRKLFNNKFLCLKMKSRYEMGINILLFVRLTPVGMTDILLLKRDNGF